MIVENSQAEKLIRSKTNEEQFNAVQMLKNAVVAAGAGAEKRVLFPIDMPTLYVCAVIR